MLESGRPQELFPLFAGICSLPGIGKHIGKAMEAAAITTPRDLLYFLPYSVVDRRRRESVAGLDVPGIATVRIEVYDHRPPARDGGPYRVLVKDSGQDFQIVFFRGGKEHCRNLPVGAIRLVSGKVEWFDGWMQMVHPDHIVTLENAGDIPDFEPVYSLAKGVTRSTMGKAARAALSRAPDLPEWADPTLVRREGWGTWLDSLVQAHAPTSAEDLSLESPARTRLAYDEFFAQQMALALARRRIRRERGRISVGNGSLRSRVLDSLPYSLTAAQSRTVDEIADDMAGENRMSRLLQGDVGSGKTLVAFLSLLIAVEAGGQGAIMAPTEILARQHLEALLPLAAIVGVRLEILTGRDKGTTRKNKLDRLACGGIDLLVGTHALFQPDVVFDDLRLAVVDEQHRFGVRQRLDLAEKGQGTDVLVMTATPIPRSLALTRYGDMDVSELNEKPPGRKPVRTVAVGIGRIDEVMARLRGAVTDGRQCYWVCPLVEESEKSDRMSAEDRFRRLCVVFGEERVGLVHGQMNSGQRDATMEAFQAGRISILVATTVIEVGVDVPNASIMVIEQPDTYGLAQLHQLRGRVGRGKAAAACVLLYYPPLGATGRRRIEVLRETEDGFRIAEIDLRMRGYGELAGTAQSGLPRFRVADPVRQAGLLNIAQKDARMLLDNDPTLQSPRGEATRMLLWLMDYGETIRIMSAG